MKLELQLEDPLNVLRSTKFVVEEAKYVEIDFSKISEFVKIVTSKLEKGLEDAETSFGSFGDFQKDVQLIFLEDSVNFCFWSEKGREKWQVEWPEGKVITGGWYGLKACFERAMARKVPILDTGYLLSIKSSDVETFFEGKDGIKIPLIEKRLENFREAARVLTEKYNGLFINVIEDAHFDAVNLVEKVYKEFNSFADLSYYLGKQVYILKRAQILANDISYLSSYDDRGNLKKLDCLTAFADYKIPQILRQNNILIYNKSLAEKVDNYELIPAGSEEEIEIRAVTIWAVELIRQATKFTSPQIDNAIWLISQDQTKVEKPYHRTYTIYY